MVTAANLSALRQLRSLYIEANEWRLPPADDNIAPVLTDANELAMLDCLLDLRLLQLDIVGKFSAQLLPSTLRRCRLLEALGLFALFDSVLLAELPRCETVGLRRLGFQGHPGQICFCCGHPHFCSGHSCTCILCILQRCHKLYVNFHR